MEKTGRIRPNSIKIIAVVDNYDFETSHIDLMISMFELEVLPCYYTGKYPMEKIMGVVGELVSSGAIEDFKDLYSRFQSLEFVANSIAEKMEKNIGELEGAPLEISINMNSWLDKPAGYVKELDDQ